MSLFFRLVLLCFLVGCLPSEPIVEVVPEPKPDPEAPPVVEGKGSLAVEVRCAGLPTGVAGSLLGVQVDVVRAGSFAPYAYALFAGNAVPKIELSQDERYHIVASWVEQGASISTDEVGFRAPFSQNLGQGVPVGQAWTYSSVVRMDKLTLGLAQLRTNEGRWVIYRRAPLTRYAAQELDFTPQPNKTLSLNFERVTCRLSIAAPWLVEGRIEVTIEGCGVLVLYPNNPAIEVECTLLGHAERALWFEAGYEDQFLGSAVWIRLGKPRVKLADKVFVVKNGARVEWGLQERK